MCRIFIYDGDLDDTEFVKALQKFSLLGENGHILVGDEKGHKDGWGLHSQLDDNELYFRSLESISENKILDIVNPILGSQGQLVAHLRKASVGKKLICNTHPFLRSGISFCHNGSIKIYSGSHFKEDRRLREGHTDSETFFLNILDRVPGQIGDSSLEDLRKALLEEIDYIKKNSDWTALICALHSSNGIILNYLWNEKNVDAERLNFKDYYTFYIGRKNGDIVLCSEKLELDGFEWEKLDNNTTLIFPKK